MKYYPIIICAMFVFGMHTKTIAQDSLSIAQTGGFYLQVYGPELFGLHINMNAGSKVSVNLGIGIDLDYHIGMNYYFGNRHISCSSIFAGLQIASQREFLVFGGSDEFRRQPALYIPIGYEYIARKGFSIQLDIGPNFVRENWDQWNTYPVNFSFKIGYVIRGN